MGNREQTTPVVHRTGRLRGRGYPWDVRMELLRALTYKNEGAFYSFSENLSRMKDLCVTKGNQSALVL